MKLVLISDYGQSEKTLKAEATSQDVSETLKSLDWDRFHQVLLVKQSGDLMEVGGSNSDGFSGLVQTGSQQIVTRDAPESVEEMLALMLSYLRGDDGWKTQRTWE